MLRCKICGQRLRLENFTRDISRPTGHRSNCKACERELYQRRQREHREGRTHAIQQR